MSEEQANYDATGSAKTPVTVGEWLKEAHSQVSILSGNIDKLQDRLQTMLRNSSTKTAAGPETPHPVNQEESEIQVDVRTLCENIRRANRKLVDLTEAIDL